MKCQYKYKDEWYTEEELLKHPDFVNHSPYMEREYINNNTAENTDNRINFFAPSTESGIFTKFIQFKKNQLIELSQRLNNIEQKLRTKEIANDKIEQTKLNNLKREIKLHIEGSTELGIKGLKLEIVELERSASVDAVGYYAEKDLERLKKLSKSNDIDDLREAYKIIDFYTLAGTFSWARKDDNPFFTKEEIFLTDEDGNLVSEFRLSDETMNQFRSWAEKANMERNEVDKRGQEITVNQINSNPSVKNTYGKEKKFTFEEVTNAKTGLKDADWVSMWTMDITQGIFSHNGIIPQVMFSALVNDLEKKLSWARKIEEKIDKINPGVQKELIRLGYSLRGIGILGLNGASYQIFKEITKEGNETGGLIQRFAKEFFDMQSSAMNRFQTAFEEAKLLPNEAYAARARDFNKAFENLKAWRRANTIIMDISKLPELTSSTAETEAYKKSLIDILGEKGYNEQLERQRNLLTKYESERQSLIDTLLIQEGVAAFDDLSVKSKNALSSWETSHNPQKGIEDYNSVAGISFGASKANNFMDYNNLIPRKFATSVVANNDTGKYEFTNTTRLTGHYSTTFNEIENNPILSEFYDVIKEVCEVIRENTPYELQRQMTANTLPALLKTSTEMISDKNTGILSSIFLAFRNLMERIRLGFGVNSQSEISFAVQDAITGRPNYRVNDSFLRGNLKSVKERETIEQTKFIQAFNTTMVGDEKLQNLRRLSVIGIERMNPSALALLANYLNVDITMAEINAGNLSKITAITGNNVAVGKYIRDYSLHTVVQTQSFDLAKIGKYFSNMTMAYAARQSALPILEIMKKHYENMEKPEKTNTGKSIFNARSEKYQMKGLRTNANKQMDDWFERVVLDNYGLPHTGLIRKKNLPQEVKDEEGNVTTRVPFVGLKIFSKDERNKIKEIDKLLSQETNEATQEKLRDLKKDFGKDRTATALFDNLLAFIRTLRLGYNLSSATTNFLEGVTSNMIMASMGDYFDPKEIYYGYNVVKHSFVKNVTFGLAETALARKNRKLMDKFNVIMDSKNELQKSSHKTYSSKLSWMNPHELNQRVEYVNQSPIMIAMMRTVKIKDKNGVESSVWNAMNKDGHLKDDFRTEDNIKDWEDLAGENYLNFKQKLHKAIVLAHGNYDELRGMMIKSRTSGKALMMFKTWIPMQLYWRFATEQDDIQSGTIGFKGRYWSYGAGTGFVHGAAVGTVLGSLPGFLIGGTIGAIVAGIGGTDSGVNMLKESIFSTTQLFKKLLGMPVNLLAGRKIINQGDKAFDSWVGKGNFTEQDARNMRANMSDLTLQLAWLGLILLVKGMFWDDDDEKDSAERVAHNILVNRLMTLSSQAAMYVNPVDGYKNTIQSNAVWQYLQDLGKEVHRIGEAIEGRDIMQSGSNAGESGLMIQTKKILLPGLFKDPFSLGFDTQAERVFKEGPFHAYFRSDATVDKADNKRDRAEYKLELLDNPEIKSIEDADERKKEIRRRLDDKYPTPAKLEKLEMTREEYEESQKE